MVYCGIPDHVLGVPMYPVIMILLLSIALYFVNTGGQIAVIIADFYQGVFVIMVLFAVTIYLYMNVSWDQVLYSLETTPIKLAQEEIKKLKEEDSFQLLSKEEKKSKIEDINETHENSSKINPFKTSHVEDFNFWYFFIGLVGMMYGTLSWQGHQAYNSSAKSAHEAKMAAVLGDIRWKPQGIFIFLVPVLVYVYMNHPDFQHIENAVDTSLSLLPTDTLRSQMRAPVVLSEICCVSGAPISCAAVVL